MDLRDACLTDLIRTYRNYRSLGDRAIAQVRVDTDLLRQIGPESNSIAIVVKHVAGNLRSRFRDFLTTDGEKPDRHRDDEFETPEQPSREQILAWWNDGWATAFGSLDALTPADLDRTVHIRREPFLVIEALTRSVTHTAYHVGQIVYLARHFAGPGWTSLSIPKGRSAEFSTGAFKQGIPKHS
jgi:uncharacterized protein DUF1572